MLSLSPLSLFPRRSSNSYLCNPSGHRCYLPTTTSPVHLSFQEFIPLTFVSPRDKRERREREMSSSSGRVKLQRSPSRKCRTAYLTIILITFSTILLLRPQNVSPPPPPPQIAAAISPYHNWEFFRSDYDQMFQNLKIFVYPDAFKGNEIFLPHTDPLNPKIGNYYSEHIFKLALLQSSFLTHRPHEAHFFFMPFSINLMRNSPILHSESAISSFVADYVVRISSEFEFWNRSGGADHFFVCCHSVGREATSKHHHLHNNAVQITCSSSYFQRLYTPHKDISLPQIWPRLHRQLLNPPDQRTELIFFAGRVQNSAARQEVLNLWGNDSSLSIFAGHSSMPYEEGFTRSRYCLHIKGYEVNTARVVDAIHYGCVPVLISNYYDLPFANVLDWSKFSIIVNQQDIPLLKDIITSVPQETYLNLYNNLCLVRKHFTWSDVPQSYDAFYMTAYQLWLQRGLARIAS